jgi:hypothetical protein
MSDRRRRPKSGSKIYITPADNPAKLTARLMRLNMITLLNKLKYPRYLAAKHAETSVYRPQHDHRPEFLQRACPPGYAFLAKKNRPAEAGRFSSHSLFETEAAR